MQPGDRKAERQSKASPIEGTHATEGVTDAERRLRADAASGEIDCERLDVPADPPTSLSLVRERSWRVRAAHRAGRREVVLRGEVWWPILELSCSATTRSIGGRTRSYRDLCACDLITGRCALVDVQIPPTKRVPSSSIVRLATRYDDMAAHRSWREFYRNYIVRNRRSFQPALLEVHTTRVLYMPHDVVWEIGHRGDFRSLWLVDRFSGGLVEPPRDFVSSLARTE